MFNKRGIGHEIDWILGVGMFILAVAFIFVLFKPGVTPVYDSQTLLNILQDGFEDSTNWEIVQASIFMAPIYEQSTDKQNVLLTGTSCGEPGCPEGEANSHETLNRLISGKDIENIKMFYISREKDDSQDQNVQGKGKPNKKDFAKDENGAEEEISDFCSNAGDDDDEENCACGDEVEECGKKNIPKKDKIKNSRKILYDYNNPDEPSGKAFREIPLEVTKNADGLIIPAFLDETGEKTKYLLVVSDKPMNFIAGTETDYLKGCYAKNTFATMSPSLYTTPPEGTPTFEELPCHVVYELGVEEKLSGINLPLALGLNDLDCGGNVKGYDCAKELWKFPALKEFDIAITSIDGIQSFAQFPTNRPEPTNVNIFVRSYNTFMLTEDGLKIPAKVRLRLWQ